MPKNQPISNPSESKWNQLSQNESNRIQVNPNESKWAQMEPSESKWIQMDPSASKWTQAHCFDPHGLGWPDLLSSLLVYVAEVPSVSVDRIMTGTTITWKENMLQLKQVI